VRKLKSVCSVGADTDSDCIGTRAAHTPSSAVNPAESRTLVREYIAKHYDSIVKSGFGSISQHVERLLPFWGWIRPVDLRQVLCIQLQSLSGGIFLDVLDRAGLGNCQHRLPQTPGDCYLRG